MIPVMIIDHLDDRTKRRARVNGRKSWFEYDVQPAGGREEGRKIFSFLDESAGCHHDWRKPNCLLIMKYVHL